MIKKVIVIVGSYRKNGIINNIVSEIIINLDKSGIETEKIYLIDKNIEFCTNCRLCTQKDGLNVGECIHKDDVFSIIQKCEEADAIIIGAPVNCFNVTAIMRKFMERLVCFYYWPFGQNSPKLRNQRLNKKAIIITSAAMPTFLIRFFTGSVRALKLTANTLGAKVIDTIVIGYAEKLDNSKLPKKIINRLINSCQKLIY